MDAAKEAGVPIPTLCHMEGVDTMWGLVACALWKRKAPRSYCPACVTAASEGMVIHTQTEKLQSYRRMNVELIFAEGNHVCSICVANGNCELQDVAVEVGMDHSRFSYRFPDRGCDLSHSQFGIDHNRCIMCTRCVRVCDEVEGAHVWDVGSRGAAALSWRGSTSPGVKSMPARPAANVSMPARRAQFSTRAKRREKNRAIATSSPSYDCTGEARMDKIKFATVWLAGARAVTCPFWIWTSF
jgi:hypothetical protein